MDAEKFAILPLQPIQTLIAAASDSGTPNVRFVFSREIIGHRQSMRALAGYFLPRREVMFVKRCVASVENTPQPTTPKWNN